MEQILIYVGIGFGCYLLGVFSHKWAAYELQKAKNILDNPQALIATAQTDINKMVNDLLSAKIEDIKQEISNAVNALHPPVPPSPPTT